MQSFIDMAFPFEIYFHELPTAFILQLKTFHQVAGGTFARTKRGKRDSSVQRFMGQCVPAMAVIPNLFCSGLTFLTCPALTC